MDTIDAMNNQMTQLQREVEELRSVAKAQSQGEPSIRSRSRDTLREQSPYDQNGRRASPLEDVRRASPLEDSRRISPMDQQRTGDSRRSSDESRLVFPEESRHISIDGSTRTSPAVGTPTGGSRRVSPSEHQTHIPFDEDSRLYSSPSQQRASPYEQQVLESRHLPAESSRRHSSTEGSISLSSAHGSRRHSPTDGADTRGSPGSAGSRASDGRVRSPEQRVISPEQTRLPDQRIHSPSSSRLSDRGHGDSFVEHGRSVYEDQEDSGHQSFEPQGRGGSPPFGPEGQSLSPRQLTSYVADQGQTPMPVRPESTQSYRAPVSASPPTRDRPEDFITQRPHSGSQRSSQRSSPMDGDDRQRQSRRSPQDRNSSALFTLDSERLVYEARPQIAYDASERYVGEDGTLYDRDGNIRPRYAQATECQVSQGQPLTTSRSPAGVESQGQERSIYPDEESRVLARQSQEALSDRLPRLPESDMAEGQVPQDSRSYRGHEESQVEGQGISSEAERYIQQLRRELLITKTALMQIQKGERLDTEGVGEDDFDQDRDPNDVARQPQRSEESHMQVDQGRGDMRFDTVSAPRSRAEVRYEQIPDEADINYLRRKLERTQEELELFRTSSNLSARDFVQASVK